MILLIVSITNDLENVLVLALPPILACFFLCKNGVNSKNRDTIFLVVTVLLDLIELLYLVFSDLFRGFSSLFGLVFLILVLALTLRGHAAFQLNFFRLIARIITYL